MAASVKRVAVILNPSSGPRREGAPVERVSEALRAAGVEPDIIPLEGGMNVPKIVAEKAAAGFGAVVAAGGDGTVSAVGAALAGTDTCFGVLPTGTLNHFAKDLELPVDLDAAARVIAEGESIRVDAAEVNGRIFLNNSSIGLYPAMVAEREALMQRGMGKARATVRAATTAFWRFPNTTVRLTVGDNGLVTRTPFVFVGNNRYAFSGMAAGTRQALREGVLHIFTVANPTRGALIGAMLLALAGKPDAALNLRSIESAWVRIETFRRHIKVALDGEVVRMTSPLVYSIRPAALKVLVAKKSTGEGAER